MRHNYEQILKDIDAQGISVGRYCKINNLSYSTIFNGLKKFKSQNSITITKVEESTDDSFEPIEIRYGKASIIATSIDQLILLLKVIDNV